MTPFDPKIAFCVLGVLALTGFAGAQEAAPEEEVEADGRVQYQLVRPDEKTPETVKPEEHNPFESEMEVQNRLAPGDTEENRVRDRLLKLPVVGVKHMEGGRMRVLLGNIILETGKMVPPVFPEQMVQLKVKNITSEYIELAWEEKRATGLPPKLMIIPINISPTVRYQMLGQIADENAGKAVNATMDPPLRDYSLRSMESTPVAGVVKDQPPRPEKEMDLESIRTAPAASKDAMASVGESSPPPAPPISSPPPSTPPASPAVESVVRMLFGNQTPVPK